VLTTLVKTGLGALALFGGFGVVGLATASLATNVVTASVDWYLARQAAAIGSASLSRVRHGLSATSGDEDPLPRSGTTRSAPASSAFGGFRLRASMFRREEFHSAPQELQAKERDSSLDSPIAWLRESWPLFLNQLLQGLFFWIDALLMLPLAGAVAAGTYGAAYKVSQGAGIISSSFTLALFPRLSRETDLSGAYRVALRVLLQIGLPLAAGVAILSAPIVALVGGREYLPDSATALAILICYLPLSYTNGLTQYVLIAAGKQRMLTMPFAAAFAFNLVANLILIPRFSYVGAAWVTVASEIVLLVPFRMLAAEVTHDVSLLQEARTPLFATLIMAPVVWWLRDAIHPLVAIPIGAAVYMVGLWALGGIDATQRRLLVQFIRP
jgi:O-antigen/teichoic acid export membrane protein